MSEQKQNQLSRPSPVFLLISYYLTNYLYIILDIILTRKGLLEAIGPPIACPKGVTTGLAWPKAGNPPPKRHVDYQCYMIWYKNGNWNTTTSRTSLPELPERRLSKIRELLWQMQAGCCQLLMQLWLKLHYRHTEKHTVGLLGIRSRLRERSLTRKGLLECSTEAGGKVVGSRVPKSSWHTHGACAKWCWNTARQQQVTGAYVRLNRASRHTITEAKLWQALNFIFKTVTELIIEHTYSHIYNIGYLQISWHTSAIKS